jgi:hypothetical protein
MFESKLEDIAQLTNEIDYGDAWKLNAKAEADKEFRKKLRDLIGEYDDAAFDDNQDGMEAAGRKIKELVAEC